MAVAAGAAAAAEVVAGRIKARVGGRGCMKVLVVVVGLGFTSVNESAGLAILAASNSPRY